MNCWKELIPNQPCDMKDLECWKSLTADKLKEGADKISEKAR